MKQLILLLMLSLFLSTSVTVPNIAQDRINTNPDLTHIWEHVFAQPRDFSMACMLLNAPENALYYNSDSTFPLASVTKLLIFIEYARQVYADIIPMEELVNIDILNRYSVPGTDTGSHDRFIAQYPRDTRYISLWEIASLGMIQFSSNAASDYMLDRLGTVNWDALYESLDITNTTSPHPLNMIPLLMNNHDDGQATWDTIDGLSLDQGELLYNRFMSDDVWRSEEVSYRDEERRDFPDWDIQAQILQNNTAIGTARDFLNVLQAIYGNSGTLSRGVRQLVRTGLRWYGYPAIDNTYDEYGSKLGFYSGGTLTLVAYGDPFIGEPIISVAFLRNISRTNYRNMLEDDSIGNLAHWMNLNQCPSLPDGL